MQVWVSAVTDKQRQWWFSCTHLCHLTTDAAWDGCSGSPVDAVPPSLTPAARYWKQPVLLCPVLSVIATEKEDSRWSQNVARCIRSFDIFLHRCMLRSVAVGRSPMLWDSSCTDETVMSFETAFLQQPMRARRRELTNEQTHTLNVYDIKTIANLNTKKCVYHNNKNNSLNTPKRIFKGFREN